MGHATAFDRAIAAVPVHAAPGQFAVEFSADWNAPAGPNGGYLAAMVLNAMQLALDEPARTPRTLTLHYLRPPQPGPGTITVATERAGRTMTTLSARMEQDGKLQVVALAAFGAARPSVADFAEPMPAVPPVDELAALPKFEQLPPIAHRFELHPASPLPPIPFQGGESAELSGWARLPEPRPIDALLLAIAADIWVPPVFFALERFAAAPTVELTIHFRHVPPPRSTGDSLHFARFLTRTSAEGFIEEDGWMWSPDGVLLAQSRQLALLLEVG